MMITNRQELNGAFRSVMQLWCKCLISLADCKVLPGPSCLTGVVCNKDTTETNHFIHNQPVNETRTSHCTNSCLLFLRRNVAPSRPAAANERHHRMTQADKKERRKLIIEISFSFYSLSCSVWNVSSGFVFSWKKVKKEKKQQQNQMRLTQK